MAPEKYPYTQKAIDTAMQAAIAVDEHGETICLMTLKMKGFFAKPVIDKHWIFKGTDILSSELIDVKSGVTITKTDRGSQIAGVVVGGVLMGGVGALIGGLTGKKVSKKIDTGYTVLKITVNDTENPVHVLNVGASENQHWHGIVSVLMQRGQGALKRRQHGDFHEDDGVNEDYDARKIIESRERNREKVRLSENRLEAAKKIEDEKTSRLLMGKDCFHEELMWCMHNAPYEEHENILSRLTAVLEAGANPNDTGDDEEEGVPCMQTLIVQDMEENLKCEMVRLLIRYGANVNVEFDGDNSLSLCDESSFQPNKALEKILIQAGAVPLAGRSGRLL